MNEPGVIGNLRLNRFCKAPQIKKLNFSVTTGIGYNYKVGPSWGNPASWLPLAAAGGRVHATYGPSFCRSLYLAM